MAALPFQLQASETLVLLVRRHWLHLYPRLALLLAIGLGPVLGLWLGPWAPGGTAGNLRPLAAAASVIWVAYWLVRAYFLWFRYQHDVWVVTNQRVVDSLRRHWFHHQMASADLVDIQDVSVLRDGVLRTTFDFGDVRIQTAAQLPNFILAAIPHPREVLTAIDAARDEARRQHLPPR